MEVAQVSCGVGLWNEGLAFGMKKGGGQGNGRELGVGVSVQVWGVLCCHLA